MASGPEGTEPVNYQTWVLKVSIHCEGCKKKIKKILHKVKGVYSIEIDAQQNRATVTGNVDAESLVQKLLKYGKHAEVLPQKNSAGTNSSAAASPAVKTEAKGNEKAGSGAAAVAAVPAPETEEKKKAEKGKAAESPESPPATAAASDEVTAPKPETDATSQAEKSISEKAAASDASSKKKGKEVKKEENQPDEREVSSSNNVTVANPPPAIPSPANIQPVYTTVSYHTANPSTSYAYYAEPPPEMPSSYAYHGNLPPPPDYPPPAGFSPDSYYYSSESYYRSLDQPSSSAGSYDMFNDENPNACKLM
ncbi:hypothetical protein KFK09_002174 [Dendrobium nobile]|uniref:HMA domain-containing protein n=1 Tax=Dendrobium nobile TaxID=94219 RepID=A0A8T3C718_DENNO|nr:hypothetical protein KFK09_002174 [Dendrobium nobile]